MEKHVGLVDRLVDRLFCYFDELLVDLHKINAAVTYVFLKQDPTLKTLKGPFSRTTPNPFTYHDATCFGT